METEQSLVASSETRAVVPNGGPRGMAALVAPEMQVIGIEALDREDFIIPRLVLVQYTSRDIPGSDEHTGQWYNTVSGVFKPVVRVVLLALAKKRVAFSRQYDAESQALCASDDGLYPRHDFIDITIADDKTGIAHMIDGRPCADCPFSQFHNFNNGDGSIPPLCAKTFAYALLDADDRIPVVMTVKRSGMAAGKQLNTQAATIGRGKFIIVGSKKIESDTGKYFVPVFAASDKTTPEALAMANALNDLGNLAASQVRVDDDDPLAAAARDLGGVEVDEQEIGIPPNW